MAAGNTRVHWLHNCKGAKDKRCPRNGKVEADSRPATGTGLGAGTSGFKGQALFPGTPESPASIPSPVLARLGELPILHCPANHLPPSMCLPHCVIITSASLTHFTCAQADANEAVRSWWQCTCGQLLPPPSPSTEPSPKVQGAYLCLYGRHVLWRHHKAVAGL